MTRPLWTHDDAERATSGRSSAPWQATGVSIDTRTLASGDLFIAIKGPHFDGHDFLGPAMERGAAAAIVSDRRGNCPGALPLLTVGDTLKALNALAVAARDRSPARRIGVTGSVGKTGTKEAIRLGLAGQGKTAATEGNLNNEWGVPLSLARMAEDAVYGVFEMGMNHAGEIGRLTQLVKPHVAVITTVEPVHLEFFESVAGIADAKAEIFESMREGTGVLNRDNVFFHYLTAKAHAAGVRRIVGFGAHPEADARLDAYRADEAGSWVTATIDSETIEYRLGLLGRHWALNSLAALAAVGAVGGNIPRAAEALSGLGPLKGRGGRLRIDIPGGSVTLIDESYNASPPAVRAALEMLATTVPGPGGRRIAALGDMLELGPTGPRQHENLREAVEACAIDRLYTVGPLMAALHHALPPHRRGGAFTQSEQAAEALIGALRAGDVIMIKGSAGMRMGTMVDILKSAFGETRAS